jgi:hypothetical protein
MPAFAKGAKAAAKQGSAFAKGVPYFTLKDGETALVRFLTDADAIQVGNTEAGGWISVLMHNHVQTKPAPPTPAPKPGEKPGPQWPQYMTAVCRADPAFGDQFKDCCLCNASVKKTNRTWALVVMREEVKDDKGKRKGIRDLKREVTKKDANGQETTGEEPDIRVINMAGKNFFNRVATFASYYETVLDRDYVITRTGDKLETEYGTIALDQIPLEDGSIYDLRRPELMKRYLPTAETEGYAAASDTVLGPIVEERASDEYYAKFFDTRVTWTPKRPANSDDATTATEEATITPAPSNDATNVDLATLRARITGHDEPAPAPAEELATEVAEERVVALVD